MKKLIALFLSLLLVLFASGCKNEKAATTDKKQPAQSNSATENAKEDNEWYTEGDITISLSEIQEIVSQEYKKPKNVIVLIGDGMGLADIENCRNYSGHVYDFGLVIQQIPNNGTAETVCITGGVTDSAASATALATGVKTTNGYVGLDQDGNKLKNASEIARENGKKVGIVTNDAIYGATPAGFSVHNINRNNAEEICLSLIDFKPDVLIGTGSSKFFSTITSNGLNGSNGVLKDILVTSSFVGFKNTLATDPKCKMPFYGFIDGTKLTVASNDLANSTEVALKRLENKNGFFLMVESCGTDKAGHNNDINAKIESVITLDRTLTVILKYMKDNPDTVLVVTSDHETGGVRTPDIERPFSDALFSTTSHTDTPVGVFAVGYKTEVFKNAVVDNTDIAKFIINAIKGELQ